MGIKEKVKKILSRRKNPSLYSCSEVVFRDGEHIAVGKLKPLDKDFVPSGKTELTYDEDKRKKVREALDKIDPFPKFTIYFDIKKNMPGHKNLNALMNSIVRDMCNSFETLGPFVFCQDDFIGIDFNYGDRNDVMDCIIDMGYDVDCKDTWSRND